MWVGLSVWIFNSFFPIFGLYCLPRSLPGSQLENYDRKISPGCIPPPIPHSPVVVKELGGTKHDLTASSSYV